VKEIQIVALHGPTALVREKFDPSGAGIVAARLLGHNNKEVWQEKKSLIPTSPRSLNWPINCGHHVVVIWWSLGGYVAIGWTGD